VLTLSPMVRVRKLAFFCFALMIGVFGIWALFGFGYPRSALPITMNVASKILAFITALTLFLPDRLRIGRRTGQPTLHAASRLRNQSWRHRPRPFGATALNGKVKEGSTVAKATVPAGEAIQSTM
jgi:hypothetical protein